MNIVRSFSDRIRWMFFPRTILDASSKCPLVKLHNWDYLLFVSEPDLVKQINKATGSIFLGGKGNEFLGSLLGQQSVFLLDGEKHKLARTLVSKAIGTDKVNKNKTKLKETIRCFVEDIEKKNRFDLTSTIRRLTFQISASFVFPQNNPQLESELFKRIEKTTGLLANLVSYNRKFWYPIGKISVGHVVKMYVERIDQLIYEQIDRVKNRTIENKNPSSLIEILVSEQSVYHYNDGFIRDNIVSVLTAGYDTTGSALSWICFWYSKLSDDEILELRNREQYNNSSNKLLSSFISECLRYCSPIEILPRKISLSNTEHRDKAHSIINSQYIKSHDTKTLMENDGIVAVCPYAVHHNEAIYKEPYKFDRMRFVDKQYKPHEYFPFGASARYCLGADLGYSILEEFVRLLLLKKKTIKIRKVMKYKPVRRNVSLWPGYSIPAQIVQMAL